MHVLVADDACGATLAAALSLSGVAASSVGTLADLDAALRALTPDVVVLDLRLPGARPEDVVPHVRLRYRGRIVVASGDDRATEIADAHGLALLRKPYSIEALVAALKGEWP